MAIDPTPSKRVRLQDVARHAQVSLATASMILNGRSESHFSSGTMAKVKTAASALGYLPPRQATAKARGRSASIGVLLPDLSNSFNADLIDGMAEIYDQHELRILLAHGRSNAATEERSTRLLLANQIDGLVVIAGDAGPVSLRRWLAPLLHVGLPCVVIDEDTADLPVDSLVSDDRTGMAMLVAHLRGRGHERIGLISAGVARSSASARLSGFREACTALRLIDNLIAGDSYDPAHVEHSLAQLLGQANPPTAVIGANDFLAARAWRTARRRGMRVPEDLAIAGYANDRRLGDELELTTIDQQTHELGRRAIRRLIERLERPHQELVHARLAPQLIVRSTA